MLGTKKSIAVLISALLISIGASPFSQANGPVDPPNTYTEADTATDFTIVLGEDSGITVEAADDVVVNKVYTFTSFDPDISAKVPDPENYVLSSSGVLLQSRSAELEDDPVWETDGSELETDTSEYADLLTALLASKSIDGQPVRDLSVLEFKFTTTDVNANSVSLDFMLASKESVEGDWDLAGIFIDGVNYAVLPNGQLLRVNAAAQITDVCDDGDADGCDASDYDINGVILSALSTKLTLNAALAANTEVHTFIAIMANTKDNSWASSLLLGNFKSYNFTPAEISTFSLGIQIEEEEVIEPPAPPLPDPNQLSTITGTTVSAADSSGNVTITVAGSFPETVRNIDVNGRRLVAENWKQDSSSVSITVPVAATGNYVVQIWNGSFPVLQVQTVIATK
jgi:hypothetical protein